MVREFALVIAFILTVCSPTPHKKLEKSVIERAESEPETATEYFEAQIKAGTPVEDQALYAYGMGIAQERLGNRIEAINNYLAAEGLGNESAAKALDRLRVKRD